MDEAAFREVYERTAAPLRAYLYLAVKDAALADDLLQEAYRRLLRARLEDANVHQARSYLYKTSASLIADHGRAVVRERKRREGWSGPAVPEGPRHDLNLDMARLFARLPRKQQTLLWLAYVEGASHREIAASMGMAEGSVRVVLQRARKRLAAMLRRHGWGPGEAR